MYRSGIAGAVSVLVGAFVWVAPSAAHAQSSDCVIWRANQTPCPAPQRGPNIDPGSAARCRQYGRLMPQFSQTYGKYGYVACQDPNYWVVRPVYDEAQPFSGGVAIVRLVNRFGLIDLNGRRITPMQYGSIAPFSEGVALAYSNGGYGYIDRNGDFVIPPRFDEAWSFANGRARVRVRGAIYQIDHSGRIVSGPGY
ncbi:MAG TPA: WG repeat-containing protein [Candidatus Elarobacter sp.]|nr:WG repeat-containing protein [Candidatus Elarobacter sp.]